jgi:hypothetical protein
MSHLNGLQKKSICSDPLCPGLSSCKGCLAFQESVAIYERIMCPYKDRSCKNAKLCDMCKATKDSLKECPNQNPLYSEKSVVETKGLAIGGGKASDVKPLQGFLSDERCDGCGKTVGSNPQRCEFCASICESPFNPAQPLIHYDKYFGPVEGSFRPYTDLGIKRLLGDLKTMFEVANQRNGSKFPMINGKKVTVFRIRQLISQNCVLGIEGMNNSCFGVVCLWILSQGNAHTRIRTDCFAGYILYKILWELMTRLFVGRDLVDAFRISLEAYPNIKRIIQFGEMDDPILLLSLLEEVGILTKGPIFSEIGCSFIMNEYKLEGRPQASSIQDAMLYSYTQLPVLPVPENGSIVSFQLCQQLPDQPLTKHILGTNFEFPHNGVFLDRMLLIPKMFIIYNSQHYLVVLCVGEAFFLSNSLSASQCGHFLPEMREISEQEAMELFRTQAHTIVFECVGDVPQSQASCTSDPLIPQSQPQVPCVSSGYVPSPPPPQVSSASGPLVPPPLPQVSCASGHFVPQLCIIYGGKGKWFLNDKIGINGKEIANGEILARDTYSHGEQIFLSKKYLEDYLYITFRKVLNQDFR